jgi:hypothetical protein
MNKEFHIDTLIQLIKVQKPDRTDIIAALEKCEIRKWVPKAYTYFVDASNANHPNSKWQFKECIVLEHEVEGTIVVDILQGNVIGGVEFLQLIGH